jgi:hypothetical protein
MTMYLLRRLTSLLALATSLFVAAPAIAQDAAVDLKTPRTIDDFQALAIQSLQSAQASRWDKAGGCTLANARVRQDW